MKLIKCCGKSPTVIECDCDDKQKCRDCLEYIKCYECERIIYGSDKDSVEDWNDGKNDG